MRLLLIFAMLFTAACQMADVEKFSQVLLENAEPNNQEIGLGLKEALKKGAEFAGNDLSRSDGYFKNAAVKILFPPQFAKAESTLRKIGLGSICDKAVLSFNRAAEGAAKKSVPILTAAITKMTIQDALGILTGGKDSATRYLKRTTRDELFAAFLPVLSQSADANLATKYWKDIAGKYNRIPFVKPVPADINSYLTNRALDGLFLMVQKEEGKIRENPIARTTELLKRVFGFADQKQSG